MFSISGSEERDCPSHASAEVCDATEEELVFIYIRELIRFTVKG
jgi:hypothetical protein